jgi:DNA-binding NarL/FixJ family response regulator
MTSVAAGVTQAARLTLVGAAPESADTAPVVAIHASDPISAMGMRAQLEQSGLRVATGDDPAATVAIAVVDALDDAAVAQLQALNRAHGLAVVLVVNRLDAATMVAVVEIGACAVITRAEADAECLATAVRTAGRGEVAFPPAMMRHLLDQVSGRLLDSRSFYVGGLSPRERQVLALVADGLSTHEVALELCYSERTIKNVLQDVSSRLQVRNRTHLVSYAIRNGWI